MVNSANSPVEPKASTSATDTPYTDSFYRGQQDISYRSAACVVPLVLSLVPVKSVIDVGCGVGTWTAKFIECGVSDALGIDGDYVSRELLRVPSANFVSYDLMKTISMNRRFDLAVCMEVAEHLPPQRAESFIRDLASLAPVVLFSAAIPGQGGTNHLNEQFLSYWVKQFAAQNYVMLDVIRPRIWHEDDTDWVYRQNAALFVEKDHPIVQTLLVPSGVDYIHPFLYNELRRKYEQPTLGYLLKSLSGSLGRSLQTRLGAVFK